MTAAITCCPERFTTIFIFRSIFFSILHILRSQRRNGGVSGTYKLPLTVCDHFRFSFQIFFAISQILNVAQARQRSATFTSGPERLATNFVFQSNFFFCDISNSECRTGESEGSAKPTWCSERFTTIFVWSKHFFDIFNSKGRTGETELSAAPTSRTERFTTILVFRSKI